jgi:hypothetical protein
MTHAELEIEIAKQLSDIAECGNDLRHEISAFSHAWQWVTAD